ncbi:phosphorylated adapter RNA export protein-like isoform X2 [Uloborus diversus]|uniref:phosphorylated adapter RNA export protein-like isoform X2 n=1 Tax=Uloborus diversus TaxID=327109 RepID=UPI002409C9C9|nr:phosphorylated adapter RNA export protein-like isoform X2 [Uloborus diversus]
MFKIMELCSNYRSQLQSSDSDSDGSEKEPAVWKRAPKKQSNNSERATGFTQIKESPDKKDDQSTELNTKTSLKRKRNNIWCEVLEDQIMSETLNHCGLKNKPKNYKARGEESYDYTLKYQDPRNVKDLERRMSTDEMSESSDDNNSISSDSHRHKRKKVRRMDVEKDYSEGGSKSSFKYKKNLLRTEEFVRLTKEEIETARKIIKILNEKKQYIIYRVVKILGIEKALNLLKMTEQVEESGGMMIMNQARRRTPGGVYFQLLKNDKDVTQEMLDKIFEGEMSAIDLKKHFAERKKQKAEAKKLRMEKKLLENAISQTSENKERSGEHESTEMEVTGLLEEPNGISNEGETKAAEIEDGEIPN